MSDLTFTIPSNWNEMRIDSLFDIQQGKQVSERNRKGDNQKHFLRTKNVYWGNLVFDELDSMHFTREEEQKLKLEYGDLLVCEGGDIGRTAIWEGQVKNCYYQNHLHRLRSKNNGIESQFGLFWFWYAFSIGKLYFGRGNVTTIPNLSSSRLSELPIIVPPLAEQRKIVAMLSTVQKAIETEAKLIERTTELKKAMMHQLFTKGTRGEKQKMTEIGLVPESWEVVEIGNAVNQVKINYQPEHTGDKKYVGLEHIESGISILARFGSENVVKSSKYLFKEGQVLYGKLRPYLDKAVIAPFDGICSTDIIVLEGKNVSNIFLVYLLHSELFINYAKSTTSGVQHPRTSWSNLKKLKIGLPENEEQKLMAEYFKSIDQKIENHTIKNRKLQEFFRTLLHQLMTAQIRVDEIDFENFVDNADPVFNTNKKE